MRHAVTRPKRPSPQVNWDAVRAVLQRRPELEKAVYDFLARVKEGIPQDADALEEAVARFAEERRTRRPPKPPKPRRAEWRDLAFRMFDQGLPNETIFAELVRQGYGIMPRTLIQCRTVWKKRRESQESATA